jgi:hypothetical protein
MILRERENLLREKRRKQREVAGREKGETGRECERKTGSEREKESLSVSVCNPVYDWGELIYFFFIFHM